MKCFTVDRTLLVLASGEQVLQKESLPVLLNRHSFGFEKNNECTSTFINYILTVAVAQWLEREPASQEVMGSNLFRASSRWTNGRA